MLGLPVVIKFKRDELKMDSAKELSKIRLDVLVMVNKSGEGHIPSSFSVIEILYALYSHMGKHDSFFLSKGHASAGYYAVLAHFGLLKREALDTFCEYNSVLGGHPSNKIEYVMNASGSLGHGLPMAVGYALGKKIRKESGKTFCLIGDGESNEGSIWEAAMHAEQLGLSNLVCVVDNNNSQTRAMVSINLKQKFKSFGWDVVELDGHDVRQLTETLFGASASGFKKPLCVIANTIKGKGVKEIETNAFTWHHKAPTKEELAKFKEELVA